MLFYFYFLCFIEFRDAGTLYGDVYIRSRDIDTLYGLREDQITIRELSEIAAVVLILDSAALVGKTAKLFNYFYLGRIVGESSARAV